MKKHVIKVEKTSKGSVEEGKQGNLFNYKIEDDSKGGVEKERDTSTYRLFTKGRPFTIKT